MSEERKKEEEDKEKRESKRAPVELGASAGVDGEKLNDQLSIKNLSQGGFCFQSEKVIEPGADIELAVELQNGDYISIKVQVVWYKEQEAEGNYLIGVQIVDTSGDDIEKFRKFYDEQAGD